MAMVTAPPRPVTWAFGGGGRPMTARAWLDRRMRWVAVPMTAGALAFIAAGLVSQVTGPTIVFVVGLPGFALAGAAGLVGQYALLRCPACRGNLAMVIFSGRWRVSPRVRFCPYCAADLDAELPAGGPGG